MPVDPNLSAPTPTRVLVIQHDDDTNAALIGDAAVARGATLTVVNAIKHELPTTADGFDRLIILGAADSVTDPATRSWVDPELALIRAADAAGVPILGICFGAQSLAVALGGSVARAPYGEYGWKLVDTIAPGVIPEGPWFQWHVDSITPPPEATVLATSECGVQAYTVGPHLAVQFHPEVTTRQATDWPASDTEGWATTGMSTTDLLEITEELLPDARARAQALWDVFTSR